MINASKLLFFAIIMIAGAANAAGFTVFENIEQCENARAAGKAVVYKPTTVAPFKGGNGWTKYVVPVGGACLGKAHVLEDGAPKNGKSVYVPEGFVYWAHTSGAFRMHDCSNPFEQLVLAKTDKPQQQQPTATAQTATPDPLPCTENCGDTTKTQTITHVVREVKVCETASGSRFAPFNGVCIFPVTKAQVSMEVEVIATCTTCSSPARVVIHSTATAPTLGTNSDKPQVDKPQVDITKKVARIDGRCVLALESGSATHYVRFETKKGTNLLAAARVSDVSGEWVENNPLSYVGDGKQTVELDLKKACPAAIAAFSSPRSFEWTAKRIGLPIDCKPKGQV